MKILKKVLACLGILSVLLTVVVVPCFAYTYVPNFDDAPSGSVGLPFLIRTNSNVFYHHNGSSNSSVNGYYFDGDYGTLPFSPNSEPKFNVGFSDPREGYHGISLGTLLFENHISVKSRADVWYDDITYSYDTRVFSNYIMDYYDYSPSDVAYDYLEGKLTNPSAFPFVNGFMAFYDGIVSSSYIPSLFDTSNDYFPLSCNLVTWANSDLIGYNSQGVLNRSSSVLGNVGCIVNVKFEVATYSDGVITWSPVTFSKAVYNGPISNAIVFNDLPQLSYYYSLWQASSYGTPLSMTVSLLPVYNEMFNYIERDDYIRNLSFSISAVPLNDDPSFPQTLDSEIYQWILANTDSDYIPHIGFGFNYFGASGDYNSVSGNFDNSKISNYVYLTDGEFNLVNWLGDTVSGFLDTPLIGNADGPHISLGTILYVCVGVGILMLILKMFAGG